jgi:hypothetical protein
MSKHNSNFIGLVYKEFDPKQEYMLKHVKFKLISNTKRKKINMLNLYHCQAMVTMHPEAAA